VECRERGVGIEEWGVGSGVWVVGCGESVLSMQLCAYILVRFIHRAERERERGLYANTHEPRSLATFASSSRTISLRCSGSRV
jgi:hypothetical protein